MAEVKEKAAATAKPAAKAITAAKLAAEAKEPVKKEEGKKEPVKKEPVKKETVKKEAVKKAPVKKAAVKKAAPAKKAPAKKEALKAVVNLQFSGKSYTDEDLIKITKDVWKYDLGKKASEFKSVELYVKPEESRAYYVINGEVTGSFAI